MGGEKKKRKQIEKFFTLKFLISLYSIRNLTSKNVSFLYILQKKSVFTSARPSVLPYGSLDKLFLEHSYMNWFWTCNLKAYLFNLLSMPSKVIEGHKRSTFYLMINFFLYMIFVSNLIFIWMSTLGKKNQIMKYDL